MPAPYGVTSTGFNSKTLAEVRSDMQTAVRRVFGPAANVDSRARLGQLIDIMAEQVSDVWQLGAALSNALNPAAAAGQQLEFLSALTNTTRKAAAKTRVTLYAFGTVGTVLSLGRRIGQPGTTALFETTAAATIATLPNFSLGAISVAEGYLARHFDSVLGKASVWRAFTGGLLASGGFPYPDGTSFTSGFTWTDGAVTWKLASADVVPTAGVTLIADCTVTGPVQAYAGSCTIINTPVAGWSTVFNTDDGVVGNDLETDTALRTRRLQELTAAGKSPLDAVRSAILKTFGVTTCIIFENTSDVADGVLAAHSFEAIVEGGLDSDIRSTIFANKPGGIETGGNVSGSVTDSGGLGHTIRFTRPVAVPIYVTVTLQKNGATYPTNGDAQVQTAVLAAIAAHPVGADVYATQVAAAAFSVTGVLTATATVGTAPSPVGSTVSIDVRSRAANTGAVLVLASNGVA